VKCLRNQAAQIHRWGGEMKERGGILLSEKRTPTNSVKRNVLLAYHIIEYALDKVYPEQVLVNPLIYGKFLKGIC
jgi:hypothetical protein